MTRHQVAIATLLLAAEIGCSSADNGYAHTATIGPFPCCEYLDDNEAKTNACAFCTKEHEIKKIGPSSSSYDCYCLMNCPGGNFIGGTLSKEGPVSAVTPEAAVGICLESLATRCSKAGGAPGERRGHCR